jgi:hypothetical protein
MWWRGPLVGCLLFLNSTTAEADCAYIFDEYSKRYLRAVPPVERIPSEVGEPRSQPNRPGEDRRTDTRGTLWERESDRVEISDTARIARDLSNYFNVQEIAEHISGNQPLKKSALLQKIASQLQEADADFNQGDAEDRQDARSKANATGEHLWRFVRAGLLSVEDVSKMKDDHRITFFPAVKPPLGEAGSSIEVP